MTAPDTYPRIGRPKVTVVECTQHPGLWHAVCTHCDFMTDHSVKTYTQELATRHRRQHRLGLVEVIR